MIRTPDASALREAAAALQAGELCAFPTETVYGLGANALSAAAVERIYQAKGRPASNPVIVHVLGIEDARNLTRDWPDVAEALAQRFWPGPLTIVTRRTDHVPAIVSAGLDTIALRAPAHPVAQALLRACELPLAAPSANRSEQVSPTTAEHVLKAGLIGLQWILDGGPCRCGIESTVVDLTESIPKLLRPGALAVAALREVLPNLRMPDAKPALGPSRSPGMMTRHYAPRARLTLIEHWDEIDLSARERPTGLLIRDSEPSTLPDGSIVERLGEDPDAYAADLYAALHRLDNAGAAEIIAIRPPGDESWFAIRDRLTRAAAI